MTPIAADIHSYHQASLAIAVQAAAASLATGGNNQAFLVSLSALSRSGFPLATIFDDVLTKVFRPGLLVEVGEPIYPDSTHTAPFAGTVVKAFLDRVRVVDMDDLYWDVAYDEIEQIEKP